MICWLYETLRYNSDHERSQQLSNLGMQGYELATEQFYGLDRGQLTFKKPVETRFIDDDPRVKQLRPETEPLPGLPLPGPRM